jgi:hypothetical protein
MILWEQWGKVEDKPRVKKVLMASPACFYQAVHSPQLNSESLNIQAESPN